MKENMRTCKRLGDYLEKPNDHELVVDQAERSGFHIIVPEANQLTLDLDDEEAIKRFECMRERLRDVLPVIRVLSYPSKSGEGEHVVITLRDNISDLERITLQAILGSDPVREFVNLRRIKNPHISRPIVLFRPALSQKVESW